MKIFRYIKFFLFGQKAKSKYSTGRFLNMEYVVFCGRINAGDMVYLIKRNQSYEKA